MKAFSTEVAFSQTHYSTISTMEMKTAGKLWATPEELQLVFLSGYVTLAATVQNYRKFYRIQIEHRAGRNVVISLCPYFWKQQPGEINTV